MLPEDPINENTADQLSLFKRQQVRVHYYDENGALHTGILVRRIRKGRRAGCFLVRDASGRRFIPARIRNVEVLIE